MAPLRTLLHLPGHHLPLEQAHAVDHQQTVKVIVLVLDRHGKETIRLQLEGLPVDVEGPHLDPLGALDLLVDLRKRKAPLLPGGLAFPGDNLGVDKYPELAGLILRRCVDDEDALGDTDLGSRKATPRSSVHGLGHVVGERLDLVIDGRDRGCLLAESFVGEMKDGPDGHGT